MHLPRLIHRLLAPSMLHVFVKAVVTCRAVRSRRSKSVFPMVTKAPLALIAARVPHATVLHFTTRSTTLFASTATSRSTLKDPLPLLKLVSLGSRSRHKQVIKLQLMHPVGQFKHLRSSESSISGSCRTRGTRPHTKNLTTMTCAQVPWTRLSTIFMKFSIQTQ